MNAGIADSREKKTCHGKCNKINGLSSFCQIGMQGQKNCLFNWTGALKEMGHTLATGNSPACPDSFSCSDPPPDNTVSVLSLLANHRALLFSWAAM